MSMTDIAVPAIVLLFVVSTAVFLCLVALLAPSKDLRDRATALLLQIFRRDSGTGRNSRRR